MRQVFQMLTEVAAEEAKSIAEESARNTKVNSVRDAFAYLDSALSNPRNADPRLMMEAMTTSEFSTYFGVAISRRFYDAYEDNLGDWASLVYNDETTDFRLVDRGRTNEFGTLTKRGEVGQPKVSHIDESWIHYRVEEYDESFGLSWRTLINDDMKEIAKFPDKLMRAAARFESQMFNQAYYNSTVHASLAALGDNYEQVLTFTLENVITAYEAFMNRSDAQGNPIVIEPRYLVAHPTKKLKAAEILKGVETALTAPAVERVTKGLLEFKADPYITTATDWYLMADPKDIETISILRLRGYERPTCWLRTPDMTAFTASGIGAPAFMMGSWADGTLDFKVLDILGYWTDSSWKGVTNYQGIFHGHA